MLFAFFLVVMNKASINIYVQVFCKHILLILLGKNLEDELGHVVSTCLTS